MASPLKAGGAYSRLSNGRSSTLLSGGSPRCAIYMRWQKDSYGNSYDHYWRADFTTEGVIRFLEEAQRWKAWKALKNTPEVTDTDGFGDTDPQIAFFDALQLQKPNLGYMSEQLVHIDKGDLADRKDPRRVVPYGYELLDFNFDRVESTVPISAASLRAQFEVVRNGRHITHVRLEIHQHLDTFISLTLPGENLDLESTPEPASQLQKVLIGNSAWNSFVAQLRIDYPHAFNKITEVTSGLFPVLSHSFINSAFLYFKQDVCFPYGPLLAPRSPKVELGPDGLRPKTYLKIDGVVPTTYGYADVQIQELSDDDYTAIGNTNVNAVNAVAGQHALFYDNHRDVTTAYTGGPLITVKKPTWCQITPQQDVLFEIDWAHVVWGTAADPILFPQQQKYELFDFTNLGAGVSLTYLLSPIALVGNRRLFVKPRFDGHNHRMMEYFVQDTSNPGGGLLYFSSLTLVATFFETLDIPYMPLQEQVNIDLEGTLGIVERGIQNPADYGIISLKPTFATDFAAAGNDLEGLYNSYGDFTNLWGLNIQKDTLYAPARRWVHAGYILQYTGGLIVFHDVSVNICYSILHPLFTCCNFPTWPDYLEYCDAWCTNPPAYYPNTNPPSPSGTILCP